MLSLDGFVLAILVGVLKETLLQAGGKSHAPSAQWKQPPLKAQSLNAFAYKMNLFSKWDFTTPVLILLI